MQTTAAAISMVTAGVEKMSWTRSRGITSLPEGRTVKGRDTVRPDIRLVNAGSRSAVLSVFESMPALDLREATAHTLGFPKPQGTDPR